jgi:hypothetical protein
MTLSSTATTAISNQSISSVGNDDAATLDMVMNLVASGKFNNERIYQSLEAIDTPNVIRLLDELDIVDAEKYDAVLHTPLTKKEFTSKQSERKGKLFEEVSALLMDGLRCFKVERNIATTVNQLDILVRLEPFSKLVPAFSNWGAHFVCECKFHESTFNGDWLDQLLGILVAQRASTGILITKKPASRKGRGAGVMTKLQLFAVQGKMILLFSRDELRTCAIDKKFLKEIVRKHVDTLAGIPSLLAD